MSYIRSFFARHPLFSFFLLAFIVRAICLIIFPLPDLSGSDFPFYSNLARTFLEQGNFGDVRNLAPGWPIVLAGLYSIFGVHESVVVLLSLVFSSLLVVVIVKIAQLFFGNKVAYVAGVIAALWPPFIIEMFYYGSSNTFCLLCLVVSVLLLVVAYTKRSILMALCAGLVFGGAVLTDSALIYLPIWAIGFFVLGHLVLRRKPLRLAITVVICFLFSYFLTIGMWTYRNMGVFLDGGSIPIVAKDVDTKFLQLGEDSAYRIALHNAKQYTLSDFALIGTRFLFMPHNLSMLSVHNTQPHVAMLLNLLKQESHPITWLDVRVILEKVSITLIHALLVLCFICATFSKKYRAPALIVWIGIAYGWFSSVIFGLTQQNLLMDIEPIQRFFFPYVPFIISIVGAWGYDVWKECKVQRS